MFLKDKCNLCGMCLSQCPVIRMPLERAQKEIDTLLSTGSSAVIDAECARCGYCNVICPTGANPSDLRDALLVSRTAAKGAGPLSLICREIPLNLMSIAMDSETEERERFISEIENPPMSEAVFYLGCGASYLHPDLAKTGLLKDLPVVGGMKYCCGDYAGTLFGDDESKIKGEQLLKELNRTGIKKLITFCPNCDAVLRSVYPCLVKGFDLEVQTITDYLLKRHHAGALEFPVRINSTISFHDPCGWRSIGGDIHEAPRKLLESMGATVVEMKHNRSQSLCCGTPLLSRNPQLAAHLADMRIAEAKEAGAEIIAVTCTGCFTLAEKAAEHGLEVYSITELAQIAIGERPPHRIIEERRKLIANVMKRISDDPDLIKGRYLIQNGEVRRLPDGLMPHINHDLP